MKRTEAIAKAQELLEWLTYSGVTPPEGSAEAIRLLITTTEKTRHGITAKMAGYAPRTRKRIASRAASSRWAGMSKEERSAEMSRRRRKGLPKGGRKPKAQK